MGIMRFWFGEAPIWAFETRSSSAAQRPLINVRAPTKLEHNDAV